MGQRGGRQGADQAAPVMEMETLGLAGGNLSEAPKRPGTSRNTIDRKLRWHRPAA